MNTALSNRIIISTRPEPLAKRLQQQVEARGGTLLHLPMIETVAKELSPADLGLLQEISQFEWVTFSSAVGVRYFFEHCSQLNISPTRLQQIKFTAIGQATALKIQEYGYTPAYIDSESNSQAYGQALNQLIAPHANVLIIKGTMAHNGLEKSFAREQKIQRLNVYHTVCPTSYNHNIVAQIATNHYDLLFFASPSAFTNFSNLCKADLALKPLRIAAIGPTTARAVVEAGIHPALVCKRPTVPEVVQSFVQYFTATETPKL